MFGLPVVKAFKMTKSGLCYENVSSYYHIEGSSTYSTAGVQFGLFAVCSISIVLTWVKFNSIAVLNSRVRPTAISNIFWILYFLFLGIRSLLLAIFNVLGDEGYDDNLIFLKILFPTEHFLKTIEVLFLACALEYQRKNRSKGFIQDVLEHFNAGSSEQKATFRTACRRVYKTTYSILIGQAFICLAFVAAASVFIIMKKVPESKFLYWIYNGCLWALCVSCTVLSGIILATKTIDEGPSKLTKILLLLGVLLSLPANIPFFIWRQFIFEDNFAGYMFTITVSLNIVSISLFMVVLIQEFRRLSEEAQWNVIDQAESYYSITESM